MLRTFHSPKTRIPDGMVHTIGLCIVYLVAIFPNPLHNIVVSLFYDDKKVSGHSWT